MEDGRRDNDGVVGLDKSPIDESKKAFIQKPAALKIYDGALSEEFCDDLLEVFYTNEKLHKILQGENYDYTEYNYTSNHKDEDIHGRLMEHIGKLYKHYLKDLGTTNMIKVSGFEEMKIKKYDEKKGFHNLHIESVDHASAIRAVSFVFFLNENEGNVDYPMQHIGVEPIKGRVVITPTSWEYPLNQHKSNFHDKYTLETYLHLG